MYTARGTIDKSHLLQSHLPMVRRIALQLAARLPASVQLDDLVQAGMVGLLDAWNRYQEDGGASFETFAGQRVRGAMLDELRAGDWGSRSLRQAGRRVERAIQAVGHRLGRAPTEAEIARELQMGLRQYQSLLQELQGSQLVYADDWSGEDGENTFVDQHTRNLRAQHGEDDPMGQLLAGEFREHLAAAITALPERDQLVLSLYYEQELNLREIGAVLEVSQSRVCQLHSQAVARLRAALQDVL